MSGGTDGIGSGGRATSVIVRPALYYPYIHVRSEHWLKATLLCAPCVKRIVPESYTPEDDPRFQKYANIKGPSGALLQSVPSVSPAADNAQRELLERLHSHEKQICAKFSRPCAPQPDNYWIHDAKFNSHLLDYLQSRDLAWHSPHDRAYGHRTWYAVHPTLGSAIMTLLGLSIARENDYDIVTPSADFDEALLASSEGAVFDALLSNGRPESRRTRAQTRRDLGQLVVTLTGVNFEALRPEDIPELQASRHFREFQRLLRGDGLRIDGAAEPNDYREQLTTVAEGILDAWRGAKEGVSAGIRKAVFESAMPLATMPFGN